MLRIATSMLLLLSAQWVSASEPQMKSASRSLLDDRVQENARVQSMLNDLEEMARSGVDPQPDKIQTIKDIVKNELLGDLETCRKSKEGEVTANIEAILKCNADYDTALSGTETSLKKVVETRRTTHTTCRTTEKTNSETSSETCKKLDTFIETVETHSPEKPAQTDTDYLDSMTEYIKGESDEFCSKGKEVEKLLKECKAAEGNHSSFKQECDAAQSSFEGGFCEWRTRAVDDCNTLQTCYDGKKKDYDDHVADTKALVEKWKIEYKSLKKILCYCDVWLHVCEDGLPADCDKKKDIVKTCNSLVVDATVMEVDYGKVAEKDQCSLKEVHTYPGVPDFVTTEYAEFQDLVKDVVPCLELNCTAPEC